jgi:diguanylate cyclase (GGDEF)-like protein
VGFIGRGGRTYPSFLIALGTLGWIAIGLAMREGVWPDLSAAALFFAVVAGARLLAFPLDGLAGGLGGNATFSLESAIVIAATACLGAPAAALGYGLFMSLDALGRALRPDPQVVGGCAPGDVRCIFSHAYYFGGLAGGLIAVWARVFGVGPLTSARGETWLVPAVGLAFLASHGLVQMVHMWLAGQPSRAALRRQALAVLAEATLLPLASGIVLIWDARRPVPFVLLGGTYLLVNFGFNQLARLLQRLRRRNLELETLNRTAHAASASLETPQLLAALLSETAAALPSVQRLEVVLGDGPNAQRFSHPKEPSSGPPRERLEVPLELYGERTGTLIAEVREPRAFGADERRLLDAISGQAATAVGNSRLYALANVDGLTGLFCRRYFDMRLAEEIERARRFGTSFCLVMLDLDDFKHVNDTYGHLVGDRALREVARIAAGQLRGVDLAARFGGEELAFLLPRTSLADAHAVAERIRERVATHCCSHEGVTLRITASLGVSGWVESGVGDPSSLVARADEALYRAKAEGKNRVAVDLCNFALTPSLAPVRERRGA